MRIVGLDRGAERAAGSLRAAVEQHTEREYQRARLAVILARPTHRPALAATGADAAIIWGVVIGFGAILAGAYLTTRNPKH